MKELFSYSYKVLSIGTPTPSFLIEVFKKEKLILLLYYLFKKIYII